jgi:hypothetical protein
MIRLLQHPIRKPKAIKNLQTANLQPVRLARIYLRASLIHDACVDAAARHPRRQHHARGPCADDQDVAFGFRRCHGSCRRFFGPGELRLEKSSFVRDVASIYGPWPWARGTCACIRQCMSAKREGSTSLHFTPQRAKLGSMQMTPSSVPGMWLADVVVE